MFFLKTDVSFTDFRIEFFVSFHLSKVLKKLKPNNDMPHLRITCCTKNSNKKPTRVKCFKVYKALYDFHCLIWSSQYMEKESKVFHILHFANKKGKMIRAVNCLPKVIQLRNSRTCLASVAQWLNVNPWTKRSWLDSWTGHMPGLQA